MSMATVTLRRWRPGDLSLLEAANTPEMTLRLGGPETAEQVRERHEEYLRMWEEGTGRMCRIDVDDAPVGGIGYWRIEHDGQPAYQAGWAVLPTAQDRGVAGAGLRLILRLIAGESSPPHALYAFPQRDDEASHALCRGMGFEDHGERSFPWRGATLDARVWALDLRPLDLVDRAADVDETFATPALDTDRWWPHYTPHWSSRERSAARYDLDAEGLVLRIDADTAPWAPDIDGEVRVSHLQTGQFSGPLGSGTGQHRFQPGLVVTEEQPAHRGWLAHHGVISVRFAAIRHPRAMVACWPLGYEEKPDDCGEICMAEIFGSEIDDDGGWVGVGVKAQNDPRLRTDFERVRIEGDLTAPHDYAVDWTPERLRFFVDGRWVKTVAQRIDYPVQLMLDVFELPGEGARDVTQHPLRFRVERVATYPP